MNYPKQMRVFWWLAICLLLLQPLQQVFAEGRYVVQRGDTLFRIARRFEVSVETLKAANGLRGDIIYVGQQLIIPSATTVTPPAAAPTASTTHTVQRGDTLFRLSARYGVAVADLRRANGLSGDTIFIGQVLTIPGNNATQTPTVLLHTITGRNQALPLDCEARSAVDWANYFGVAIDELEFFRRLPVSDDPDTGFVGNVNGLWGQTPPNAYGVHAEPIAALLRQYNVKATAKKNLSLDDLRRELEAGRPVIAWVVGQVMTGRSFSYTASNGHTSTVAPYEHTVIVIGYANRTFTFLDNAQIYTRPLATFQSSWGALGNMAVVQ